MPERGSRFWPGVAPCTPPTHWKQTAENLGAPIVKALLGKAAVPDDSPYTTGSIGLLGTKPSQEVMEDCDTLLIVGSSFPYIEFLPKPGQASGVQIDLDPLRIGLRYPVEVGLVGDCRRSLERLLPLLRQNGKRSFLRQAQAGMKDWQKLMDQQAAVDTQADEASVPGRGTGQAPARQRDRELRFGHHRDLVGAPYFGQSAGRCIPSREIWPPWRAGCRTPSPRRSPIRIACAWDLWAMAALVC